MASDTKKIGEALANAINNLNAGLQKPAEFVFYANIDDEDPAYYLFITPGIAQANSDSRSTTLGKIGYTVEYIKVCENAKPEDIDEITEAQEKLISLLGSCFVPLNGQDFKPVVSQFEPFDPEEVLGGTVHGRIALHFTGWY